MAIKLKKTLYVGIGGTGVTTLLKVKKCFIDSYGEIPPMIGFLAIDTDGAANNKSVTSNRGEMIKLAPTELLVCSVKGAFQVYQTNPRVYDWVPLQNVSPLSGIQGGGAGQVRSNGRFIAYYNKKAIDTRVSAAVNKIDQLIPQDSKYVADVNKEGVECYINVVGSIAGGTGSGMMIDVLCIIRETLKDKKIIRLCPWIVLPEVFRAMASGPSMANVLYNTYGALKELDYLMHYDPTTPAINFGYARIDGPLFDYAYVINNTNSAGVSFNSLDDITDVMAKSMFLPANKMGDEILTPFDNILRQKDAGTYVIENKKAWAASTSSAELIYDGQAVGRVYAYRTIEQLCTSMLQSQTDGSADANRFVDDPEVLIRENEGKDNVIDALLLPGPEYMLNIDENTTQQDIDAYIENNCNVTKLAAGQDGLNNNLGKKLMSATIAFDKYIAEIMSRQQGKVDAAIKFVDALKVIMSICKAEMAQEEKNYQVKNEIPVQWDYYLNKVTNRGIMGIIKPINGEAIEALQFKLSEVVTNRREEIRRSWALKFYNEFETVVNKKLQVLNGLKSNIEALAKKCTGMLLREQQQAQSTSNFQVFLHKDGIDTASMFTIDDNVKANFVTFLGNGMSSWIGQSQDYMEKKLWNFAKGTDKVKEAVNTDIDTVLRGMKEDDVKEYLERLKILASPLWTYNTHGFSSTAKDLDSFVVVGVGNRDTSILKTDAKFNTYFDIGTNKASFASTNQDDRVYVLVVEDLLPIYAVNNFKAYEYDHQDKVSCKAYMVNYIDEKLNNRMNSENFNLMPQIEKDNVLEYWVMGFVFGLIHYDKEAGTYWIRSKSKGDAIKKFRFDLNKSRDVAYDMFKSEQLYKEVEETVNAQIARTGRDPIDEKINAIKADGTYFEKESQLSPLERENIDNPKFRSVKDLVVQEIKLMTN